MVYLGDILEIEVSPLINNVIVSQIMVVFFKVAIEIISWQRQQRFGRRHYSKEFLQILLSGSVLFWPLFDQTNWSWRLASLAPAVLLARFLYKGAILKDPDDMEVQLLSQSSSPSELLYGPVQMCLIMLWLGLWKFMTQESAVVGAAVGIGDGLAPLIGALYGRHVYQMPLASAKTMEGSVVGVFLGTAVGCYLFLYMMGLPFLPLRVILAYAGVAATVEGTAPVCFDNVSITVMLHLSMERVYDWFAAEQQEHFSS